RVYFDAPCLSPFARYREVELARLIFHELAHQVLYVKDDTAFNESFAVAVEEAGLARWLPVERNPGVRATGARAQALGAAQSGARRAGAARAASAYGLSRDDARCARQAGGDLRERHRRRRQ